jgi:hypothetical protein
MDLIWVDREGIYFFEQDWTGRITLIRFNKSTFCVNRRPAPRSKGRVSRDRDVSIACFDALTA